MLQTLFVVSVLYYSVSVVASHERMPMIQDGEDVEKFYSKQKLFQLRTDVTEDKLAEIPCGLYPEVVQVQPRVKVLRNRPQFVQVNRCKGSCSLPLVLQKCKPVEKLVRAVQVFSDDSRDNYSIENIEEHKRCTCACQVTCNEEQDFIKENCICRCKHGCEKGEQQNPLTCQCNNVV